METDNVKEVNQFKIWLVANGINQKELSRNCGVGVTSLHHLINEGKGTRKTIEKIAECLRYYYGKDITLKSIANMISSEK